MHEAASRFWKHLHDTVSFGTASLCERDAGKKKLKVPTPPSLNACCWTPRSESWLNSFGARPFHLRVELSSTFFGFPAKAVSDSCASWTVESAVRSPWLRPDFLSTTRAKRMRFSACLMLLYRTIVDPERDRACSLLFRLDATDGCTRPQPSRSGSSCSFLVPPSFPFPPGFLLAFCLDFCPGFRLGFLSVAFPPGLPSGASHESPDFCSSPAFPGSSFDFPAKAVPDSCPSWTTESAVRSPWLRPDFLSAARAKRMRFSACLMLLYRTI